MPIEPSPAVLRAGDVLALLASHPSDAFTVSEVAREVAIPRATCDAILQALAEHRLALRRDDLRYELGVGCIALGDAARAANPTLRSAGTEAEQLARTLSACTAVSVRIGNESRVSAVFDHGPPFGLRAHVGLAIPLVPPFGAVYMAWSDADRAAWIAHADEERREARDGASANRYRRALDAVRRRGYSVTVAIPRRPHLAEALETLANEPGAVAALEARDELIIEMRHSEYLPTDLDEQSTTRVSQMSAPVFDHAGRVVASILLLGPEYELTNAELQALAAQVVHAAERATKVAGGRPPTTTP
jgi:DNA-binding IclR family transcriptional regulator